MITVLTYQWGHKYKPEHVRRLAESVAQWLPVPHRFVCVTDRTIKGIETMSNPVAQYDRKCYRRLWLFSDEAKALGRYVLHLDLDVVVCGDLTPLVSRGTAFSIYRAGSVAARGYSLNPSVLWLETGTQTDIWKRFTANPQQLSVAANADGFWGSDQAVISHLRKDSDVDTFVDADGVVSFRRIRAEQLTEPPVGTRIVSFHGKRNPFEPEVQDAHPWIQDCWKVPA